MSKKRATEWIFFKGIKMYIRVTFIVYEGDNIKKSLQIASMDAEEPGSGRFKEVMPVIEKQALEAGIPILMIENVMTDQLKGHLERTGWEHKKRPGNDYDVCMYKKLRELNSEDKFDPSNYDWMMK